MVLMPRGSMSAGTLAYFIVKTATKIFWAWMLGKLLYYVISGAPL